MAGREEGDVYKRQALDSGETHPLLGRTTVSLTTLSGGVKTNVIPDAASATLDIRTLPGDVYKRQLHLSPSSR